MNAMLQKQLYAIGIFLFLVPSIIFLFGAVLLLVNLPIHWVLFPLSVLVASILTFNHVWNKERFSVKIHAVWISVGMILLMGSIGICNSMYDCSFDGQWYHQDAVIMLSKGWNPVWDPLIPDNLASGLNANYINHYPKAPWTIEAIFFLFFKSIEAGKAIHIILSLALFLIGLVFIRTRIALSWMLSILLSLLIAGSTITLGQAFSFYVDGILFSCFCLFLIFIIEAYYFNEAKSWLLGINLLFLVNIKFTGLVYVLVILFFYLGWVLFFQRNLLLKRFIELSFIMIIGVVLVGYPTYVRNTLEKGHPFFPIMGENNEGKSIAEVQYPKDFFSKNRLEKLAAAHSAIPLYTDHEHGSVPKPLFDFKLIKSSIPYYRNHQPVTMSPFGPFEAELWLVFIVLLVLFFIKKQPLEVYLLIAAVFCSMLIQPECWNLRYAPQLLILIVLFLTALLKQEKRVFYYPAILFLVLFALNNIIPVWQNWRWVGENNRLLRNELELMRHSRVKIQSGWMKSFELKLQEYDIKVDRSINNSLEYVPFNGDAFTGWKHSKQR